ncbi:hypothetical protein HA49_00895 [Tatumella morbirosei]|uniref:Uncharacterized protein n=1 Tax=Tatumella morbirosei TaxID=642227 RepID=A0A095V162_9GAMM|nr:hypothetical protein HA49_00895 [Tatumella morbirosei]
MENGQVMPEGSINNQIFDGANLFVVRSLHTSGISGGEAGAVSLCKGLALECDNKIYRDSLQLWRHPELLQQILIFLLMNFCSRECVCHNK